jgi:hypothetical protein
LSRLRSAFSVRESAFEATLLSDVFSANAVDHEFENLTTTFRVVDPIGRGRCLQYFEIIRENLTNVLCYLDTSPADFAWEKASKALALCASRSHIVAVR